MAVSPAQTLPAAAPGSGATAGVRAAIADAARATGADFSYLVATAQRESGMDARARAGTSSAAGLFQFVEQTWLGMVSRYGAQHGLGEAAAAIQEGADGRYRVADPAQRKAILDLRFDAGASAAMAGEYAGESARALSARLGREPSQGELYAAHFLGIGGAARLIQAADADPSARADRMFPAAARANKSIFTANGAPASVGQVLANLTAKHGGGSAPASAPVTHDDVVRQAQAVLMSEESVGAGGWTAPPRSPGRVLSPLVIEALAALGAPSRDRDEA